MNKIIWSGRSHNFLNSEIKFLSNIIKYADPLTNGKYLKLFEKSLSNYLKCKNVFALSSAAAGLEIISILCNLKKNDEVIIPAHTYCASAIPFARRGAKIVWSDIDISSRVVSIEDILKKITNRTKVIVVVHLYGYAFDVPELKKKLKDKKILLVEDCAQAIGAEINGKKVGTFGDFSCFSFQAQKNITTLGEGGAIYVKNKHLALKVPGLRYNGHCEFKKKSKFYWLPAMTNLDLDQQKQWPYKFSLTEIQAAAGYLLLRRLDKLNQVRVSRAKKFIKTLKKFPELSFNSDYEKNRHVYHLLSAMIISKDFNRNDFINHLYKKYKIKCAIQYYPLYKYDLFKKMGLSKNSCKNTNLFYNNMVSFPFHVWMSKRDFNYLIISVKKTILQLRKK
tara:strand:- start:224 stop:1402 length:1179 start_codon:yes stop_codon:yes gene_type:complete